MARVCRSLSIALPAIFSFVGLNWPTIAAEFCVQTPDFAVLLPTISWCTAPVLTMTHPVLMSLIKTFLFLFSWHPVQAKLPFFFFAWWLRLLLGHVNRFCWTDGRKPCKTHDTWQVGQRPRPSLVPAWQLVPPRVPGCPRIPWSMMQLWFDNPAAKPHSRHRRHRLLFGFIWLYPARCKSHRNHRSFPTVLCLDSCLILQKDSKYPMFWHQLKSTFRHILAFLQTCGHSYVSIFTPVTSRYSRCRTPTSNSLAECSCGQLLQPLWHPVGRICAPKFWESESRVTLQSLQSTFISSIFWGVQQQRLLNYSFHCNETVTV